MNSEKGSSYTFYIIISVLSATIIVIAVLKFFLMRGGPAEPELENPGEIKVMDLSGNTGHLSRLLIDHNRNYVLLFKLTDCYSCIYKGLSDLKRLKQSGNNTLAVVIHDNVEEVKGWSGKQEFYPFYILKTVDFYHHIQSPILPVIIVLENGDIKKYSYILP